MIATGNHMNFNSLRGAPPADNASLNVRENRYTFGLTRFVTDTIWYLFPVEQSPKEADGSPAFVTYWLSAHADKR
jgi:hypothetical protein